MSTLVLNKTANKLKWSANYDKNAFAGTTPYIDVKGRHYNMTAADQKKLALGLPLTVDISDESRYDDDLVLGARVHEVIDANGSSLTASSGTGQYTGELYSGVKGFCVVMRFGYDHTGSTKGVWFYEDDSSARTRGAYVKINYTYNNSSNSTSPISIDTGIPGSRLYKYNGCGFQIGNKGYYMTPIATNIKDDFSKLEITSIESNGTSYDSIRVELYNGIYILYCEVKPASLGNILNPKGTYVYISSSDFSKLTNASTSKYGGYITSTDAQLHIGVTFNKAPWEMSVKNYYPAPSEYDFDMKNYIRSLVPVIDLTYSELKTQLENNNYYLKISDYILSKARANAILEADKINNPDMDTTYNNEYIILYDDNYNIYFYDNLTPSDNIWMQDYFVFSLGAASLITNNRYEINHISLSVKSSEDSSIITSYDNDKISLPGVNICDSENKLFTVKYNSADSIYSIYYGDKKVSLNFIFNELTSGTQGGVSYALNIGNDGSLTGNNLFSITRGNYGMDSSYHWCFGGWCLYENVSGVWKFKEQLESLDSNNFAANSELLYCFYIYNGSASTSYTGSQSPRYDYSISSKAVWKDASVLLGGFKFTVI